MVPLVSNVYLPLNLGTVTLYPDSQTKIVTVSTEDARTVFETKANTVGQALGEQGIVVDEADLVEPSIEAQLSSNIVEVNIVKARQVVVYDGQEIIFGMSPYLNAGEILSGLNIDIYSADIVTVADPLESLVTGPIIYIDRALVVNFQVDGKVKEVHTRTETVATLLFEEGISLGGKDRVEPSLETSIINNMKVNVVRVSESENSEVVELPFSVIYKDDSNMIKGETRVEQHGKIGRKEVKFRKIVENGEEVKRVILEETILEVSVNKIIIRGTKTYATGAYADYMNDAAAKYGIDAQRMSRMMYCESGGNPMSVGGGGSYHGLFQYVSSTWTGASRQAGWEGSSIYNPKAQIYTTAWKISVQGYKAWGHCGYL